MNFKLFLIALEYISSIFKSLYNKDKSVSSDEWEDSDLRDAVGKADNGDQRDLEQKIFADGGNPSSGVYSGLSKRKTKKR